MQSWCVSVRWVALASMLLAACGSTSRTNGAGGASGTGGALDQPSAGGMTSSSGGSSGGASTSGGSGASETGGTAGAPSAGGAATGGAPSAGTGAGGAAAGAAATGAAPRGGSDNGGAMNGGSGDDEGGADGGAGMGATGNTAGSGAAGAASGLEPYRRCDDTLGEDNNPGCDSGATCSNDACVYPCAVDPDDGLGGISGPGDECPRPLTGNASVSCGFGQCGLSCPGDAICPQGWHCLDEHYAFCVFDE